jgi:hypothetical protein
MLYLEADYSKRMVEKHAGETGLFGRIGPTTTAGQETEVVKLEDFLSNQIENMIEDKSVMEDIDAEIKKINEKTMNDNSRTKNLKSQL